MAVLGVLAVSSATGEGLDELRAGSSPSCPRLPLGAAAAPAEPVGEFEAEHRVYRPGRRGRLLGRARGRRRLPGRSAAASSCSSSATTLKNEEALAYLEQRLNEIGVVAALTKAGFEPGDDVRIGEHEFELHISLGQAREGGRECEAEHGDQPGPTAGFDPGVGDHRVDQHHQQGAGGEAVDRRLEVSPEAASAIR